MDSTGTAFADGTYESQNLAEVRNLERGRPVFAKVALNFEDCAKKYVHPA